MEILVIVGIIATVIGAIAAVVAILKPMRPSDSWLANLSIVRKSVELRPDSPRIVANGSRQFQQAVFQQLPQITTGVDVAIRDLEISEADPGRRRLVRFVDTSSTGDPRRVRVLTNTLEFPEGFWRQIPVFAKALADLENKYVVSKFFETVSNVAANLEPVTLSMRDEKKKLAVLSRSVLERFHVSVLQSLALPTSPAVTDFYRDNFSMQVQPGHIGRYVTLKVLQNALNNVNIDLQEPRLLASLDSAISNSYKSIRGSDTGTDLLPQVDTIQELIRGGHKVLVALSALKIPIIS